MSVWEIKWHDCLRSTSYLLPTSCIVIMIITIKAREITFDLVKKCLRTMVYLTYACNTRLWHRTAFHFGSAAQKRSPTELRCTRQRSNFIGKLQKGQ